MKQHILFLAAGILALSACNNDPIVADGPKDPQKEELAKAAPVELPPMVTASRTYRCKDNSLAYVDFYSNNTAVYKASKTATTGTTLMAAEPGKPFTADGYSVSANSENVQITAPGKGSQSCHV